jgi:hypothetical protein
MIALFAVAFAAPAPEDLERWLEWYAAGERERLWEVASDRYRSETCGGDPDDCPQLDAPLGTPTDRRFSCDRRRCTFVRRDVYTAPPLPWTQVTEVDWIVTSDLAGRFEGVAVDFQEPGEAARSLGWVLGLGCGIVATLLAAWGALFALIRAGRSPRTT